MTINEIENTLHTLCARHPTLDEKMLVTLLIASGWEEKTINDAITLFRNGNYSSQTNQTPSVNNSVVLDLQQNKKEETELKETKEAEEKIAPLFDYFSKLKEETKEIKPEQPKQESVFSFGIKPQPQAQPQLQSKIQIEELPHNLPLKPFESTSNVLPFSKYKTTFFGDLNYQGNNYGQIKGVSEVADEIFTSRDVVTKEDKDLIILATTMLFLVLLLLGYMYIHGRI